MSSVNPPGIANPHIRDLRPKEYVVEETRRHWFSIVLHAGRSLIVDLVFNFLLGLVLLLPIELPSLLRTIIILIISFPPAFIILWHIFDWTNDYFILTNQRVIFLDKVVGVRETRSEAPMNKVHNVRIEFPGRFAQFLNFGSLALDTAGLGVLSFDVLPNPRRLRERILSVRQIINQEALPTREERRRKVLLERVSGGTQDPEDQPMEAPYTAPREEGMSRANIIFPFTAQRQGETVVWHRHWIFLLKAELAPLGIILLIIVTAILLTMFTSPAPPAPMPADPYLLSSPAEAAPAGSGILDTVVSVIRWVLIVALLPVLFFIWYVYEDWRNDKYSLTHDRVMTVEKRPLGGYEVVTETMFGRITDVSYNIVSPLAMILNFGTVVIKTPGEATAFVFRDLPDPRGVQQEITTRLEAHRAREAAQWDNDIIDWLSAYDKYVNRRGGAMLEAPTAVQAQPVHRPRDDFFDT